MVTPHCAVEGHVGFSGGRMVGGTRCDEVFVWTDERFNGRGSAGKARVTANEHESATASTASRNEDAPIFVSIASDTPVNMSTRPMVNGMIECILRKISRCSSKPCCSMSARKMANSHACKGT